MKDDQPTAQNGADQANPDPPADAAQLSAATRRRGAKAAGDSAKNAHGPAASDPGLSESIGLASPEGTAQASDGPTERGWITPRPLPDTFKDERDDVLTVINELEDQLDRYEEIRATLERELGEAKEQNQAAGQRIQELEWRAVTLQTRVEALEQVRQETALLEEEIADVNAHGQRLAEQLSRSAKECARLNGELKTANKQLEELWSIRKQRDALRVDIKNARAKLDQLERAQQEALEERKTLQAKVQESQVALDATRAAKHQLEATLRAVDERNEELRRLQEELQQKYETARGEKKNLQAQLTHLERENARLIEQQRFYECELTSLRSMNRNAESALANVKKAFSEVRVALSETKARARRRTIETWPRATGMLRGLCDNGEPPIEPEADEAGAATTTAEWAGMPPGSGAGDPVDSSAG